MFAIQEQSDRWAAGEPWLWGGAQCDQTIWVRETVAGRCDFGAVGQVEETGVEWGGGGFFIYTLMI